MTLVAAAILGSLYVYYRLDDRIRRQAQQLLAEQYPDLQVRVRAAKLLELEGFELRDVSLRDPRQPRQSPPLLQAAEILVRCHPRWQELVHRRLEVREIIARRVIVRCQRKGASRWSIEQLARLPRLGGGALPVIRLENSALEVVDQPGPGRRVYAIRDINIACTPRQQAGSGRRLLFEASFSGDHLQRAQLRGEFNLQSGAWRIAAPELRAEISPALRQQLPRELSDMLGACGDLQAQAVLDLRVWHDPTTDDKWAYRLRGSLSGGRLDPPQLPYPLTDLHARFEVSHQDRRLSELHARYGTGAVQLSVVQETRVPGAPLVVEGTLRNFPVDASLVERLDKRWQDDWHQFLPVGKVDAQFHLRQDGASWQTSAEITCRQLALQWCAFPYPVRNAGGTISVRPGEVAFELTGQGSSSPLQLRGHILRPGPEWTGWCEAESVGPMAIDAPLLSAGSAAAQQVVRAFDPRGSVVVKARVARADARQPPQRSAVLNLVDCAIRHAAFPYPLVGVQGQLTQQGDDWTFERLEGRNDSARIRCQGAWRSHPPGGQLHLDFVAQDLALEDELREALDASAQELWRQLRPRGRLQHVTGRLLWSPAWPQRKLSVVVSNRHQAVGAAPQALSITPQSFPYRIEQVTGQVRYEDGQMQLLGLSGRHGASVVTTHGEASISSDGSWRLAFHDLAADRLQLDREFLDATPPRLRRALTEMNLRGAMSLAGDLQFDGLANQDGQIVTTWDLDVDLEDGQLGHELKLENVCGSVELHGRATGEEIACRGALAVDSVLCRGQQLADVRGPLWFDGQRILFGSWSPSQQGLPPAEQRAPPITGRAFDGRLSASAEFLLDTEGSFGLQLELRDAALSTLLRDLGRRHLSAEGRASAQLLLSGNQQGQHSWQGKGTATLRDAELYRLPFVLSLLQTLRTGSLDRTAFTEVDVDFRLQGGHTYLDRVDLRGDALTLKGRGEVGRKRELDLDFYTVVGREDLYLSAIRPLLGQASRRFLLVKVTGTMDQPEMTREVLPGLNETLQQLFPDATADAPPAPPARPRATEFDLSVPSSPASPPIERAGYFDRP